MTSHLKPQKATSPDSPAQPGGVFFIWDKLGYSPPCPIAGWRGCGVRVIGLEVGIWLTVAGFAWGIGRVRGEGGVIRKFLITAASD